LLVRTKPQAAQQTPAKPFSHRQTQIGPYRCALPADFTRPTAGSPLLFSPHKGLLYFSIKQA